MRSELWWVKSIQHAALTSSFFCRWVLLTCSTSFRLSLHLLPLLSGTCEPAFCRNKQSFMNKRQGLTTLKETKQRETLDQRGLAQFQGQIQRQMLVLFQNERRKIPQLYRKSSVHFPTFPVSAEDTKHFLFPSGSREPSLTTLPLLLNGLSFSLSACRASLKQLCLVQKVEVGRLSCS